MNPPVEKAPPRLLTQSSDSSPQLRRAISLRSRQTLRSLRPAEAPEKEERPRMRSRTSALDAPQNGLTASAPMERPKKNRRKKLRKRFSLSLRSNDKQTQEDIANLQREVKECNAKISIGEDVAFSHKEHVGKDDANQFLLRLLKLREERYLEMHQEIRANITASYVHLRPPNHMAQQFLSIVSPSEASFRRKNKKAPMQNSTKAYKFWIELVPQRVPPTKELALSPRTTEQQTTDDKSKKQRPKSKKEKKKRGSRRQSGDKKDTSPPESPLKRRYEEIVYFPENLVHCGDNPVEPLSPSSGFLPKGAPDYAFFVFANEQKTAASQVLAVIPLADVKITPISPVEFSISYVNRLPNSHCFQFRTPELMTTWLKTLELATQMQIHNPFTLTRSRSASITHGLSMIKDSFSAPRFMRKSSKDNGMTVFGQRSDDSEQYYKYVCWDVDELKSEGAGAFTDRLQLQEVYMNDQDPHSDPVRQGWRLLGGTLTDLVCWCLLSSERGDKPNIDVAALVYQYEDGVLLEQIDHVFDVLRAKLIPQNTSKSNKRKSFFRVASIGQELTQTAEVIKEDQISAVLHLERRLFNFLFQWIQLRVQMSASSAPQKDQFSAHLRLAYHCGQEKVEELKQFIQSLSPGEAPSSPGRVINPCDLPVSITELPPLLSQKADVLMEQLTVLEIDFYNQLQMNEFLHLRWEKEPHNAPAIQHLIQHYNHTGHWVATEIMQAGSPKMQAKMFAKFVRVAQRLLEIRNYATCAQILSGVSHRAVQRLKKLSKQLDWKTVERYEALNELFDPVSGYSNYRKKLCHEAPMIPFLAVHLRTMTLIEEGNPRTLGDDPEVISFARMVMYTESLAQLRINDSAMMDYGFEPQPDILQQLEEVFVMTEEELFAKSEELEPLRGGLAAPRIEVEATPSDDHSQEEDEESSE